jgi:hypothetical protein
VIHFCGPQGTVRAPPCITLRRTHMASHTKTGLCSCCWGVHSPMCLMTGSLRLCTVMRSMTRYSRWLLLLEAGVDATASGPAAHSVLSHAVIGAYRGADAAVLVHRAGCSAAGIVSAASDVAWHPALDTLAARHRVLMRECDPAEWWPSC